MRSITLRHPRFAAGVLASVFVLSSPVPAFAESGPPEEECLIEIEINGRTIKLLCGLGL